MGNSMIFKISVPTGQFPDVPDEATEIYGNEKDMPDRYISVNS